MGVRTHEQDLARFPRALPRGPTVASALGLSGLLFVLLVSNGRPIGAGDTRPTERVAASLVQEADFDLDEYPEVEPPFARTEGDRRVSIYPVLSAVLAAPLFALARVFFVLDETGTALVGKWAASLFSALAAGALYLAVGRRQPTRDAALAAFVFGLGTTVWSTSQALWQHPAAVLFLSLALLFWVRAEDEGAGRDVTWAARAGLPLALALAARPADMALVGVLSLGLAVRWPRAVPRMILWALPPVLFVLAYQWWAFGSPFRHGFSGALGRFAAPWGEGQLGLLVSPGKGLLWFTPVAAVAAIGLGRALWRGDRSERYLAATLGLAVLAHLVLMGRWSEWHGGECWGPRLLTDALPLLFLFLPEGLGVAGLAGLALALLSVGVQALGAFAYDYRWERLHQREGNGSRPLGPDAEPHLLLCERGRPASGPPRPARGPGDRARAPAAALRAGGLPGHFRRGRSACPWLGADPGRRPARARGPSRG